MNIQTFYNQKIKGLQAEEKRLKKKSNRFLYAKLVSFACFLFLGYQAFTLSTSLYTAGSFLCLAAYLWFCKQDNNCQKRLHRLRNEQTVCLNELKYLQDDFSPFQPGLEYQDLQHNFSYDLDIFGEFSLYHRINRTITQQGSDLLAQKLTDLCENRTEIMKNQQAIQELSELADWRIRFLANEALNSHSQTILSSLQNETERATPLPLFLTMASVVLTVILLTVGIAGWVPLSFFTLMFLIQLISSALISRHSTKAYTETDKLYEAAATYLNILKDIYPQNFKAAKLTALKSNLFDDRQNCLLATKKLARLVNLFNQRSNALFYVLLNGICLYDVWLIRSFNQWKQEYAPFIDSWLKSMGELDALNSLATYCFNHPENHYPEILPEDEEVLIQAEGVYHPFLAHEKAVSNSFSLKKKKMAIITGANMAGKSTFLRTIGITYILATCGVSVCAQSFRFNLFSLFSSMRTTDNLSKDISYFNAELIRLKQLIEFVKSKPFTLIILDEILKGTNSKDKLEGSMMFLREISKYNVSGIIATHDLELAALEEKYASTYKNYCFEIELSEDIKYTYKITEGVAQNLNASYLLAHILEGLQDC